MVVIEVIATLTWIIFGTILTFWHRALIARLYALDPDVWEQLSDGWLFRRIWSRSLDLPFWSWRSLAFFIFGMYKKLDNPSFARDANFFRYSLIIWLLGLLVPLAYVLLAG